MGKDYKKIIILFSILAVGIIAISCIWALKGDSGKEPKGTKNGTSDETVDLGEPSGVLCLITDIDLDSSVIAVKELETGEERSLTFTGGSDIRTKSNRVISATLLKKGNIARVTSDEDGRLISLIGAAEVWTYKNINNMKLFPDLGKIEIGSTVYRFGSAMKVLNEGEFVPVDSLVTDGTDMVDLYGIDNQVYLIKVISGHGYLSLENSEDFIGGTIFYGIGKSAQVTEDLRVMLPEGEHEITVENADCTATATVKITNGLETCFDLEGYGPEPVEYGEVVFKITPEGSLLYVDGVKTWWAEPVQLTLGTHEVEVELGGYTSYKGSVSVDLSGTTKTISLSPAPSPEPEDAIYEDSGVTDEGGNQASDIGNASSTNKSGSFGDYSDVDIPDNTSVGEDDEDLEVVDGDRPGSSNRPEIIVTGDSGDGDDAGTYENGYYGEMTVYCSEETEIYINDVYKGRITNGSLTIPKPIGTVELKLVKKGYVTKRYTLTLDTEEENSIFRFPSMTPEG